MFSLELYTPNYKQYADEIGFYVQRIGGEIAVRRHDVEFTVPVKYKDFVLIQYPFLKEIPLIY
jgi:tRNA 2-selenouridine synthase SelU